MAYAKEDSPEKWKNILELYNHLLTIEYSPIAALNRAFVISRLYGEKAGITEAEKLGLEDNQFYHALLGNLYAEVDRARALKHYETALRLAQSPAGYHLQKYS